MEVPAQGGGNWQDHSLITDTRIALEIPEGGYLRLDPAGPGPRAVAYIIDFLITFAASIVVGIVTGFAGGFGGGIAAIVFFLLNWFYPVFFEVWFGGATPGKRSIGLMVVNDDGTPVTFGPSLIRNLLRVVDSLPVGFLAGVTAMICSPKFQRLGDMAAGTMVIYANQPHHAPQVDVTGTRAVPNFLSTDEQRSLVAFAERSRDLSVDRQEELAGIIQPVIKSSNPVRAIKEMANSLSGRQTRKPERS